MSWQAVIALAAVGSLLVLMIAHRKSITEFFGGGRWEMSRGTRWMLMLSMLYWGAIFGQIAYMEGCSMITFLGHEAPVSEEGSMQD